MGKPKQIEPLIDPNEPASENRHYYYLLEEMHSPPISTPNAISWKQYQQPRQYLTNDPYDKRLAYGFIEYETRVSRADLKRYNMLPFDYAEAVLFDLWTAFGEDEAAMVRWLALFFRVTKRDQGLKKLNLAIKLVSQGWNLRKVKALLVEVGESDKL